MVLWKRPGGQAAAPVVVVDKVRGRVQVVGEPDQAPSDLVGRAVGGDAAPGVEQQPLGRPSSAGFRR
ncbi:hypothetical protein [Streptomyces sp. TLI_053]|uniref:hypothetical protein n=1 Tax=Streptomyces sp. TLI_053 TaxID=1855352 RepID=UPI001352074B|nr:hypothetical protein [Streptomyces sp. TLI_053]